MERGIAERALNDPRAFKEEADLVLVGRPDAAVHLNALVGNEPERIAGLCLGDAGKRRRILRAEFLSLASQR